MSKSQQRMQSRRHANSIAYSNGGKFAVNHNIQLSNSCLASASNAFRLGYRHSFRRRIVIKGRKVGNYSAFRRALNFVKKYITTICK